MNISLAPFRHSGSFVAGTLIGLSIVFAGFAVTDAQTSLWQGLLVFGAPVALVLGLLLQILVTAKPRRGLAPDAGPLRPEG